MDATQRGERKPKHPASPAAASFQDLLLQPTEDVASGAATGSGAVLHQCPTPNCGRQFSRKYTLTEHLKTHTGEKPHVCPVRTCSKRFSTSGNLARHKRLHGFIQPLECPVEGCVCTFPSDNKLEKHMKFHYGGPVHVCEVLGCGKTFSTTGNLNRHMKNQHPDVYNPNATPTAANKKRLKKSPTSAEDWSHSSGHGNDEEDDDEEDEDEEVDDDDADEGAQDKEEFVMPMQPEPEQHPEKLQWPHGDTIKVESGLQSGAVEGSVPNGAIGMDDDELKPDEILDSLSSLLEDTGICKQDARRSVAAAPDAARTTGAAAPNLFDDIIRFHVEDLGGYHATVE